MKYTSVSLILGAIVALLLLLDLPVAGADWQPDLHLTLYLGEDRWAADLEAPSILPEQNIAELRLRLEETLGIDLQVSTRQRNEKDFVVIRIPFESELDMRQSLTRLELPLLSGDEASQGLFTTFEFRREESTLNKTYALTAETNQELVGTIGALLDVYIHVDMPGSITESNAQFTDEGLPTWRLSTDADPAIFAQSRVLFGGSGSSRSGQGSILPWVAVAGGVIVAVVVAGVLLWGSSKRRKNHKLGPTQPDPWNREHDTWSDEINDVSNVHLSDDDGNFIDVGEDRQESYEYR